VVKRNIDSNWQGHEPATSAALIDVLTTATTGSARVSRSDRILFTACEFWASARNHVLSEQLSDDAVAQLESAEASFGIIGLVKSATILRNARRDLTEVDPPVPLADVARAIERSLADVDEPVDQMIAQFANEQARHRHHNNENP
jgi:hypothetical protein